MKFIIIATLAASLLTTALADSEQVDQSEVSAPPGCYYDGTAPFCAGSCPDNYRETDKDNCGDGACCWTGYKALCCHT
ncbi:hypothetical protein P691DRAFT_667021 [Macrolepiota fuliginosa MF-IS2]|uniref:Uncharacterized protein n=1 Tax=Macrolepiota fuliginosa MF-IS2 TaxID=1400762 RepID=A0A9P5XFB5_9AGAR|nr:hypothetical protein P691DRAFT_667021 [Macrolepiota fuliginosa MF-IS2]